MVPQKRYKPHTSSDRRRYVDEVDLEPAILFYMQKPDELGIPLRDALHGRFARLAARDEAMFKERGPSISVRINVSLTPHSFAVSLINIPILMAYKTVARLPTVESSDTYKGFPQPSWAYHAFETRKERR
jgi:hypothetical protein